MTPTDDTPHDTATGLLTRTRCRLALLTSHGK